jgi:hypothetical protein
MIVFPVLIDLRSEESRVETARPTRAKPLHIEQFDTKHSNLLGSLGKDLLLDQSASLLDRYQ